MDLRREIEREQNPEVLRQFSLLVLKAMDRLEADNARLRSERDEELRQLQNDLDLKIQLTALRRILFGKKSEKRPTARKREKENDKLLLEAQSLAPPPRQEEIQTVPSEEVIHELTEESLTLLAEKKNLGETKLSDWEPIPGFYETHQEMTILERTVKKFVHRRQKYRKKDDANVILTAPGPEKILPGCRYSLDFALSVVADKFQYHIPYERQRRRLQEQGLEVSVKTLTGLSHMVEVHLEAVLPGIQKDIFTCGRAIGIDETPWPILNNKDDDGYLWSISNQGGSYYRFEPTRSGKVAEEMLEGYQGPLINDCFSGFNRFKKLPHVTVAHCWAHGRRKFIEIEDYYPKETKEILDLLKELFQFERQAQTWEELKKIREEQSKPLAQKIYDWLMETKANHLKESRMQKACNYFLKHWPGFQAFLEDVRIPLTNNDAERALRHGVMGRKNAYGSKTINGADTAATLYTVIQTCKKMELNPRKYIRYAVTQNNRGKKPLTPMAYAKKIRAE